MKNIDKAYSQIKIALKNKSRSLTYSVMAEMMGVSVATINYYITKINKGESLNTKIIEKLAEILKIK